MNKFIISSLVICGSVFGAVEEADTFDHEITLSNTGGRIFGTAGHLQFGLDVDYSLTIAPNWQWNIRPSFYYSTGGTSAGIFSGFTYNLLMNNRLQEAFFLTAGLGVHQIFDRDGYTSPYLSAEIGKRFEIIPSLSYRPTITITKAMHGYLDPYFTFKPIAFSLQF